MRMFAFAAAAAMLLVGAAMAGDVVIPKDTTPFKVGKEDTIRLTPSGIAGTQVSVAVTGPAKETIKAISYRLKGHTPIGSGNHEVDVKPTGTGRVTVEVTVTPPNAKPTTEKYEFDVE